MPCDGIAVMNATTDQQEDILDEIRKANYDSGQLMVGPETRQRGVIKLHIVVPMGVKLDVKNFETHHHDHHAPQLAYTAKQVQR